jgi:hypothetical protein
MTDDGQAVVLDLSDLRVDLPVDAIKWQRVFDIGADGFAKLQSISAYRETG